MSFDSDWNRAVLTITNQTEQIVRAVALQLFSAVILATPVKTGRLRGNWQCSIGSPADSELDSEDPSGGETIGNMANVVGEYKLGPSLYLTNNLPYAAVIEGGSSQQAPSGMVAVNVAEFQRILDDKARTTVR